MEDLFLIASAYNVVDPNTGDFVLETGSRPINLFTSLSDVDLKTMKSASAFSTHYGQDFVLENIVWSGDKLLNSCEDKLCQKC
jgi:hypothetical protein